ncbi:MAG: OmpH family outer membrane protein [Betaproteobacteria bacterium]
MDHSASRFLVAAAFCLAAVGTAGAQAPAAPNSYKVGYVNVERVMRDSRASQNAQKGLDADFEKRSKEIRGGPEADRERRGFALAEELNQRRDEEMKVLIEKTNLVVRRIAEAEKFDAVFFEAAYASKRIDITDAVVKALDAAR